MYFVISLYYLYYKSPIYKFNFNNLGEISDDIKYLFVYINDSHSNRQIKKGEITWEDKKNKYYFEKHTNKEVNKEFIFSEEFKDMLFLEEL